MGYLDILSNKHESNTRFWKLFGNIISPHKRKKHVKIEKVLQGDEMITDPKRISEVFNNHFVSIGKKLTDKFDSNDEFKRYMKHNCTNSIYLEPINTEEIIKEIKKLKDKKSPGPDNIPPKKKKKKKKNPRALKKTPQKKKKKKKKS